MQVEDAIRLRRSVKPEHMSPEPLDPQLLERCFESANWAPSHGLTEPWRFIIFQGPARLALGEAILSTMQTDGQPLGHDDPRREKIMKKLRTAPACVAIVCAPSDKANIVEHEEIASVAMAVQNLTLAARALGVASFWSSGSKAFHPNVARFLGLEGRERCLGFLYLGRPATDFPEGRRGAVGPKLRWVNSVDGP